MFSMVFVQSIFFIYLICEFPSKYTGGLLTGMEQSLPGDPIEYGSHQDADNDNYIHSIPYTSVLCNIGQSQSVSGSTRHSYNYSIINQHNGPSCARMMRAFTAPLPPPPVPPNTPGSRVIVNGNIECTNCGTKTTSAWRRSVDGKRECNACNVFFRRNGRKRPPSMRCDTITRRNRRQRHNSFVSDAKGNLPNFGHLQKSPSKFANSENSTFQLSDLNQSQSTVVQNFLVPSNVSCVPSLPRFVPSNAHYSIQNPMMMSCTNKRTVFNSFNIEQQAIPSEINDQLGFTTRLHSASLETNVFDQHVLAAAPNPRANMMKRELVNKEFSLTGHKTEDHQAQPCRSSIEYSVHQELAERNMFNNYQFEDQYSEACSIINKDCQSSSPLNCSSAAYVCSPEVDPGSAGAYGGDVNEVVALFQDDSNDQHGDRTPPFLSLH